MAARPWPPSAEERRAIDAEYERQCRAEARAAQFARAFEEARRRWLADAAPHLVDAEIAHECLVFRSADEVRPIVLQDLSPNGVICAAHDQSGAMGFGSAAEALSAAAARPLDDPWVSAAVAAWTRTWPGGATSWRRSSLFVGLGEGEMLHVSPAANRASIAQHGLDWRRMRGTGIAGSAEPEAEGIFLCAGREDAEFFAGMRSDPCDVWSINVDGLWLEGDPGCDGGGSDEWVIVPEPIAPTRVRLIEPGIRGER
jgi:hypothetical protein